MPHITLEGQVDLENFCKDFEPINEHAEGEILKAQDIFINKKKDMLLLDAVVIEDGPSIRFLIQVAVKDKKTTVRIYSGTDPERTHAVKKLLALVAKKVKDTDPLIRYGTTNLPEFLL
jgi:hypothetical protein